MTDLADLKAERDKIVSWYKANPLMVGTPDWRRRTLTHRLLVDLIARDGGSKEDLAYVFRELAAINAGERDGETAGQGPLTPPPKS